MEEVCRAHYRYVYVVLWIYVWLCPGQPLKKLIITKNNKAVLYTSPNFKEIHNFRKVVDADSCTIYRSAALDNGNCLFETSLSTPY